MRIYRSLLARRQPAHAWGFGGGRSWTGRGACSWWARRPSPALAVVGSSPGKAWRSWRRRLVCPRAGTPASGFAAAAPALACGANAWWKSSAATQNHSLLANCCLHDGPDFGLMRVWAGGKAEIGKAESRNRKTESPAISGCSLPRMRLKDYGVKCRERLAKSRRWRSVEMAPILPMMAESGTDWRKLRRMSEGPVSPLRPKSASVAETCSSNPSTN